MSNRIMQILLNVLVMMFIAGYWRIHINTDLFKDIRLERQALQELPTNRGIIAM